MNSEQQYIDVFKEHQKTIDEHSAPVMNICRKDAFDAFCQSGFPTTKMEDYLYTDIGNVFAPNYGMNVEALDIPINPYEVFHCGVPGINSHLYFVVNDQFYHGMDEKSLQDLPEGVLAGSLREMATKYPDLVKKYYNKIADTKDALVNFNTAFAEDGFFLYVPKGIVIEKTLQLIEVMRANVNLMANSHNLIILEEGAQAKLLVCAHTMDDNNFIANRQTEVFVGKGAVYEQYTLENTNSKMNNINALWISQSENSNVLLNGMTLNNGNTRNMISVDLNGQHSELMLCGMAIGDRKQHIDNHTFIRHAVSNCKSQELYKYVLDGEADGAFSGKILVAKDAQKTEANQVNKNICNTRTARMRTKPQLEIYADDVKCNHGATIGQFDDTALFYLRSRGIPLDEARMLLMFAFVNDVVENIKVPSLKDTIHRLVENRFRGEFDKCDGCSVYPSIKGGCNK